jgi:type IX secretion system PorP/SprF family membrane protein
MKSIKINLGLLFVGSLLLSVRQAVAQQLPLFTQYAANNYFHNPAIAGAKPYIEATSANRLQWMGITDAPRTYALSLHAPIQSKNMGVGGCIYSDIAGPTRRSGMSASYAYHLKINERIKISFSISAGLLQYAVDVSKLTIAHTNDYVFANSYTSKLIPDIGASFLAYDFSHEEGNGNWWVGGYFPQLYQSKLNLFETPTPTGRLATHFYGMGGYRLWVTDKWMAEPSALIKFVSPLPAQADIGGRVIYDNTAWAGITYRTNDAVGIMAGYSYKDNLSISYSYDVAISSLKKYSNGTHEIVIGFKFKTHPAETEK